MKIIKKSGRKCKGDNVFYIKSDGEEAFSLDKLFVLINQLSLNEYNIYIQGGWDKRGKDFLFEVAINEAVELGKGGIDLLDIKNDSIAEDFCKRNHLVYTKWKQTKLEVYW